jgi:hypothetical protein
MAVCPVCGTTITADDLEDAEPEWEDIPEDDPYYTDPESEYWEDAEKSTMEDIPEDDPYYTDPESEYWRKDGEPRPMPQEAEQPLDDRMLMLDAAKVAMRDRPRR